MDSTLEGLSEEQRQEALALAAVAQRAEERAERRALERAKQQKAKEKQQANMKKKESAFFSKSRSSSNNFITYIPKKKRQKMGKKSSQGSDGAQSSQTRVLAPEILKDTTTTREDSVSGNVNVTSTAWTQKERDSVRQTYLGKTSSNLAQQAKTSPSKKKKKKTTLRTKKATFRFTWDDTDDTLDANDPLYSHSLSIAANRKRNVTHQSGDDSLKSAHSLHTKPLGTMTSRDWRILRENYEIVVKGGRAPPPLRNFREANLHPTLIDALENVMGYKSPTAIQRQAIPIGLQRRDMIGIAETGSGKTCAFGVPLLQYLLSLPHRILDRVADEGPLALVMAPTRELALQIHGEFEKMLSRQSRIRAISVVGGQSIQHQAQQLREGVHAVIGTPGRINDCIEMSYLVLNQCCYVVADEADRMVDMGFAPQMESILDAMGGALKSENEQEAYKQEELDLTNGEGLPKHRLMSMFTATMPLEVERIAKQYLRHPAIISIGDQDSVKNARIVQRVIYLSGPSKKEAALRDLILNPRYLREKVIVFVNEKKNADGVGRIVERTGRTCVVLHGGKSQEQREENLLRFRQGNAVLVATDVAGRGLDVSDVAHVINYDLPTRSIDSYCHRIGRTGRAGKEGLATSLMTDEDEGIMVALKSYLEATGNPVPEKLARHRAANASSLGNLIY
ncbi:unnamed protein product [Cylindrotheca closterium]|uniref:RNA helicase n=1 Tax=Cylindrotheca closterium TaxID=2856 RepID=A0AAD2FP98_9STRA|nr:unnamed protein product [Cylindrotheca closterium]